MGLRATTALAEVGLDETYLDYAVVLVNNESWRDTLATVPFEKRLLLMPKCLREENRCPAPFDEFGLLCKMTLVIGKAVAEGATRKLGGIEGLEIREVTAPDCR